VQRSFCFCEDHSQVRFWPIPVECQQFPKINDYTALQELYCCPSGLTQVALSAAAVGSVTRLLESSLESESVARWFRRIFANRLLATA
jgi:hypothetical protein